MKKGEMEIEIELVPLSGKPTTQKHTVPVTVTGSTVGAIAAKLGIDLTNRNVSINKVPATKDTVVNPGERLEVVQFRVAERPQSS
jgi:sulfur carrier protein ThiS